MDAKETVVQNLYSLYEKNGYITENQIFNQCDEYELSIFDTNFVSGKLIDLGVLISSDSSIKSDSPDEEVNDDDEEIFDFSQTDYNIIYDYFLNNYPGMQSTIDFIKTIQPIQHGEIYKLIEQVRSGNNKAKEIVFYKNMRLGLKFAYAYRNKTAISLEDIFQEACIGILKAIDSYDPHIHTYFTSYCGRWIIQRIDRYIGDHELLIRIPTNMLYSKFSKIDKIIEDNNFISQKQLISKISNEFNISESESEQMYYYYKINDILYFEEKYESVYEWPIFDKQYVEKIVETKLISEYIIDVLNTLQERSSKILKLRYGFYNDRCYTLEEVGLYFNITRERIRQIENKALRQLSKSNFFAIDLLEE